MVPASIPGLAQWVKLLQAAVQFAVAARVWRSLAAVALIRPLTWEFPCAAGVALKKTEAEAFLLDRGRERPRGGALSFHFGHPAQLGLHVTTVSAALIALHRGLPPGPRKKGPVEPHRPIQP